MLIVPVHKTMAISSLLARIHTHASECIIMSVAGRRASKCVVHVYRCAHLLKTLQYVCEIVKCAYYLEIFG